MMPLVLFHALLTNNCWSRGYLGTRMRGQGTFFTPISLVTAQHTLTSLSAINPLNPGIVPQPGQRVCRGVGLKGGMGNEEMGNGNEEMEMWK